MAISFSRPDPSSPSAISSASFAVARRGYDQSEVRDLLRMVAAEMARLQERERFLERELKSAQRAVQAPNAALDEDVVARLLGEETVKVLTAAREAASQIKIRAEENAARLLRESTDESQRVREEAEIESARRRQDAAADADAELEMAKQQGREMVNEVRAYRERVLSELSRRRETAREQIEALVDGRDRLLQAFERARSTAVDIIANLAPLTGPTEFVNLAATTGPVPMMVPGMMRNDNDELDDLDGLAEPSLDGPPADDGSVADDPEDGETADTQAVDTDAATETVDPATVDTDMVVVEEVVVVETVVEIVGTEAVDETEHVPDPPSLDALAAELDDATQVLARPADEEDAPTNVVSLFAGEITVDDGHAPSATEIDSLFAKLRASREGSIAQRAAAKVTDAAEGMEVFQTSAEEPETDDAGDDTPFARRDSALTPIILASARKLKRALADEQNEILHVLRGKEPVRAVETLLPGLPDQVHRYATAIAAELQAAALAGAAAVDDGGNDAHTADLARTDALAPARQALSDALVAPLRDRVERAVADVEGDNGELVGLVRAIYREWKTQRIDEHLDDIARMAFGRGALAAITPGTPIRWIVDPAGPDCPDAEDNSLAGTVAAGESFPTAHECAPAHPGCRCLIEVDRH